MKVKVRNRCSDFTSYRAARVKSLFNAESGCNFSLDADLPIDDGGWKIGMVVGPSGSGKTSMGGKILPCGITDTMAGWPEGVPIGVRLLRETLAEISAGVLTMVDQDDALATWEPSFTGAPRLRRPELKMIGPGPEGFSVAK
jgi:hypothetical protein